MLTVRSSSDDPKTATKIFQEVQFANEGDFYRVELHEQNAAHNWAYFYHPNVYKQAMSIFAGEGKDL